MHHKTSINIEHTSVSKISATLPWSGPRMCVRGVGARGEAPVERPPWSGPRGAACVERPAWSDNVQLIVVHDTLVELPFGVVDCMLRDRLLMV